MNSNSPRAVSLLVLTPSLQPDTGWGRYSKSVVTELNREFDILVVDSLPDAVDIRSSPQHMLCATYEVRSHLDRYDAVLSTVAYPYSLLARLATLGTGKPYFVSCHGTYAIEPLHDKHRIPASWALRGAAGLFPVSSFTAEKITDSLPGLSNITVVSNGVDLTDFEPTDPFDIDHRVLLTVGPFKRRKGQRVSIEAFARVAGTIPDVHYHFIGGNTEGDYCRKVKKVARKNDIRDRVHSEGYVSENQLERWYATADVFVLTPQYVSHHFEGFGLVYLEANRYGVPTIGVSDSGARDAIDHGRSGLCVDNDARVIGDAISRLFTDEELYDDLSDGAVEWAIEHDWSNTLQPMMDTIAETVSR